MATECHVILCGIPHNIMDSKGKKRIWQPSYLLFVIRRKILYSLFVTYIYVKKNRKNIKKSKNIFIFLKNISCLYIFYFDLSIIVIIPFTWIIDIYRCHQSLFANILA